MAVLVQHGDGEMMHRSCLPRERVGVAGAGQMIQYRISADSYTMGRRSLEVSVGCKQCAFL